MILLTGASGMLGTAVQEELHKNNIEFLTTDLYGEVDYICDLLNKSELINLFNINKIDSIINCAAWTNVDGAEDEENKEKVYEINVKAIENICEIVKEKNIKLLHISTDYVFDGQGDKPWKEDDIPNNPINYYGQTKLMSEKLVDKLDKFFIIRTQWLYGKNGKNFVDTMIKAGKSHNEVRVVNDQIGSPTCTSDLAKVIVEMIQTDKYGYYHVVCSGNYISWCDFCEEIYKCIDLNTKIIPVSTVEYGLSKARRPYNSRLDRNKYINNGFSTLPDWKESLKKYLDNAK